MSGSNDILAQSLLAQVRQRPQQSVQSRLAAQMLQQSQSNEPIYNGNAGIALRAGQGLLAGFLSQYAQRGDEEREAGRLAQAEQYQSQRDQASEARVRAILGGGFGGTAPVTEAPAMPAPVQQEPLPPAPGAASAALLDTMRGGPAPAAPAGDPSLPRGLRNNNPLNLSYVEGQPGVQGSDGRFGRYATPEDGIAASVRQLQMYGQRGLTTLPQIINRWAPPSENDTGAYVSRVAQAAGLPTDQPLNLRDPDTLTRLVGAMATVENGRGIDPTIARRGVDAGLALPVSGAPASSGGSPPPALPPPGPGQGAPPPPVPDIQTRALAAAASSDPNVQRLAPLLMQMAQRGDRTNPTVEIDGPQGPGTYERLPTGQLRFVGGRLPPQAAPRQPNPDFEPDGQGGLRPIRGGPADPRTIQERGDATRRAATMPAGLQTQEAEDLTAIGTASGINERLTRFSGMIGNEIAGTGAPGDRLALGPVQNLVSGARNTAGLSSPNSANYASFRAELERLRNESLRLNTGVQTDGDAQRAWNELITNINDPAVVRQRLGEIQQINMRGMALREALVQNRRAANGLPELDTRRFRDPGPDATAAPGNAAPRAAAPASGGGGWSIRPAQ